MKKIGISIAAMAMTVAAFAAENATLDQIRGYYAETLTIAVTNRAAAQAMATKKVIIPLASRKLYAGAEADALAAEIDAKYASIQIESPWNWATATADTRFPKSSLISFTKHGIETNIPYVVSLARQKVWYCGNWNYNQNNATLEELVGILDENISLVNGRCRIGYGYDSIDRLRKSIQAVGVKAVKKYLRRQGKSFVTKDGVNPCEGLMTELNTALNAPYFEGLNAWLAKVGVEASIDISHLPTSTEVNQLRESILDADKDLNAQYEFVLKVCLGVEGYNAFVKEYNGDK